MVSQLSASLASAIQDNLADKPLKQSYQPSPLFFPFAEALGNLDAFIEMRINKQPATAGASIIASDERSKS